MSLRPAIACALVWLLACACSSALAFTFASLDSATAVADAAAHLSPSSRESLCRALTSTDSSDSSTKVSFTRRHAAHLLACHTASLSASEFASLLKHESLAAVAFALAARSETNNNDGSAESAFRALQPFVDAKNGVHWTRISAKANGDHEGDDASLHAAALFIRLIASHASEVPAARTLAKAVAKALVQNAEVDSQTQTKFFLDEAQTETLHATAAVLKALSNLQPVAGTVTTQADVFKFANFFEKFSNTKDEFDAAAVAQGLTVLSSGNLGKPLFFKINKGLPISSESLAKGTQATVTDALGNPVEASVQIVSLVERDNTQSSDLASKTSVSNSNGIVTINLVKATTLPGVYILKAIVEPSAKSSGYVPLKSYDEVIVITGQASVSPVTVSVHASKTESVIPLKTFTASATKKHDAPVDLTTGQYVSASFAVTESTSGKYVRVNQAFVRLINEATLETVSYPAALEGNNYVVRLSVANDIVTRFGTSNAVFSVAVIVGDNSITNPVVIGVGQFFVTGTARATPKADPITKDLPEIHHIFRTPEKRPPAVVSYAFTGMLAVPLLFFIIGSFRVVGSLQLPSTTSFVDAFVFHVGLAAILVLIFVYWLMLDMFTTMGYLAILSVPTFFFGRRLLSSIPDITTAKAKAD